MSGWDWKGSRVALLVVALAAPVIVPTMVQAQDSSDDSNALATCCLIALAIYVVVNVALTVWLLNDAHARGVSPGAWVLVFLVFGILGLLAYMLVRPRGKLVPCPECGRQKPVIDPICPHCGRRVV